MSEISIEKQNSMPLALANRLFLAKGRDIIWRNRPRSDFKYDYSHARWNKKNSGKVAGSVKSDGYLHIVVTISGRKLAFKAHRIMWLLCKGAHPSRSIDHIDHDKSNNEISNLRSVSISDNGKNRSIGLNNTSGFIGVSWSKVNSKWHASLKTNGEFVHVGFFDKKDDAVKARSKANKIHGFHKNHGAYNG